MTLASNLHTEPCSRCRAKGVRYFRIDGTLTQSPCKFCGGTGERTYAASKEQRAHINAMAKARKAKKITDGVERFIADHPAIWAWMETSTFPFAAAMHDALLKYGALTEKQMAAAIKCVRRDT